MYVDDLYAFAPEGYLRQLSAAFADASNVAGTGARAIQRTLGAVMPDTKGWFNLLSLFFSVLPWNIQAGDRLLVTTLLRAGSYASRYSQAFSSMRAFCHGFHGNIRGASPFATRALSVRTVHDIAVWRFFLCMAYHRPAILSVPISWSCLLAADPETQARHADRVAYVDAASTHQMCGAYIHSRPHVVSVPLPREQTLCQGREKPRLYQRPRNARRHSWRAHCTQRRPHHYTPACVVR
jgi:hypothetical protein